METIGFDIWKITLGTLLAIIGYWAKSTKDDLKRNDRDLEKQLSQYKIDSNTRISKVEDSIHQGQIVLTEIRGDLKSIDSKISQFSSSRKENHDLKNEISQYQGSTHVLLEALKKASEIIDGKNNEKK